MSFLSFFTRPRVANPTQGNIQFVPGEVFYPGAEGFAAEQTVTDPAYLATVFPQWNFRPLEIYQPEMVFQSLSLPEYPPQGFPYGGMLDTSLTELANYPDVEGVYYS